MSNFKQIKEAAELRALNKQKKERIMDIISEKEDGELKDNSISDLKKMLSEL